MKSFHCHFLGIICMVIFPFLVFGQDGQIYKHPKLAIQIEAPSRWKQLHRHADAMVYEIADPENSVHAMLWYTATMQDAKGYLEKMADMKDFRWEGEPKSVEGLIDDAWLVDTTGDVWGMDARVLLAVIHHGNDSRHLDHNALFIVMVWCPRDEFSQHQRLMMDIFNSVKITK